MNAGDRVLNRYEIVKKLGYGAFSNVYQATILGNKLNELKHNLELEESAESNKTEDSVEPEKLREVVIKIVSKSERRDILNSACEEINIHKNLNSNRIIKFYEHFEDNNNIYMIIELYDDSLKNRAKNGFLCLKDTVSIILQVTEGLLYLKENLIIHRDIKIENLLIDANKQIKICDFGLAEKLENKNELVYYICGTPNYISPEMLDCEGYSFEIDIWALGIVFYKLLTGKIPFKSLTKAELYKKIREKEPLYPNFIDLNIKHILEGMLNKNRDLRFSHENVYDLLKTIDLDNNC